MSTQQKDNRKKSQAQRTITLSEQRAFMIDHFKNSLVRNTPENHDSVVDVIWRGEVLKIEVGNSPLFVPIPV